MTTDLKQRFFEGMSFAACTVNVVTTDGPAGRAGMTVSAMTSVSAESPKPTLLVCINEKAAASPIIRDNGVFCVNVLREHQSYISDVFAGRHGPQGSDRFACTQWRTGATGSPLVKDALVAFDCRIVSEQKVGTHYILIGAVEDLHLGPPGSALVYANRAYALPRALKPQPPRQSANLAAPALRLGCFHTFGPFLAPRLMRELIANGDQTPLSLVEGDAGRMREALASGEVELALTYDFALDERFTSIQLLALQPYVLISPSSPLAELSEITAEDLRGAPMISVTDPDSSAWLERRLQDEGVAPNVVFKASSMEMARGLVGHGLGFAMMLTKPASPTTYDGAPLSTRRFKTQSPPAHVVLASRSGESLSPAAVAMIQACVRICLEPG